MLFVLQICYNVTDFSRTASLRSAKIHCILAGSSINSCFSLHTFQYYLCLLLLLIFNYINFILLIQLFTTFSFPFYKCCKQFYRSVPPVRRPLCDKPMLLPAASLVVWPDSDDSSDASPCSSRAENWVAPLRPPPVSAADSCHVSRAERDWQSRPRWAELPSQSAAAQASAGPAT